MITKINHPTRNTASDTDPPKRVYSLVYTVVRRVSPFFNNNTYEYDNTDSSDPKSLDFLSFSFCNITFRAYLLLIIGHGSLFVGWNLKLSQNHFLV